MIYLYNYIKKLYIPFYNIYSLYNIINDLIYQNVWLFEASSRKSLH